MESKNNTTLLISSLVAVVILVLLILLLIVTQKPAPPFSPDILTVTSPVNHLTGMLKKRGTDFILTYKTKGGEAQYTVIADSSTVVTSSVRFSYDAPGLPPYLPAFDREAIPDETMADVITSQDLRLLQTRRFKADQIVLPQARFGIIGTVVGFSKNNVRVKIAADDMDPRLRNQELSFEIFENTGFWRVAGPDVNASSITLAELLKGNTVAVNTVNPIALEGSNRAARLVILPPTVRDGKPPVVIRSEGNPLSPPLP